MNTIGIVVETKACSGCGMCAAVCPVGAITIEDGFRPHLSDDCTGCAMCYEVCPRVEMPYSTIEKVLAVKNLTRNHDDAFYESAVAARKAKNVFVPQYL